MPYEKLTPKQQRVVSNNVKTLFSPRAFRHKLTESELKLLAPLPYSIQCKSGTRFMTEKGEGAIQGVIDSLSALPELSNTVSIRDIEIQVLESYSNWLEKSVSLTGEVCIDTIVNSLLAQVKPFEFLVQIEGIDLTDINVLSLGPIRIQRSNPEFFDGINFEGFRDKKAIFSEFQNSLWLIGSAKGSPDVASAQFDFRVNITFGILGICGAVLYKGAIWRSRVSLLGNRKDPPSLRWDIGGENPSVSQQWGGKPNLALSAELVDYLNKECFLQRLSSLPERQSKSELEEVIMRSLYWFSDAYRDRNPIMQFLKLWTCAECFFAIKRTKTTEQIVRGITATLACAGFNIINAANYSNFKKQVEKSYDLRSRAIHSAQFEHVQKEDVEELSYWVAWVVLSMIALTERGYQTLTEIQTETQRLDHRPQSII